MSLNLPTGARLLTDAEATPTLRRLLPRTIQVLTPADFAAWSTQSPATGYYLLRTLALVQAGSDPAASPGPQLSAALPLALFGTGAGQLAVEQIMNMSAAERSSRVDADQMGRRLAGASLTQNQQLTMDDSIRGTLRSGGLDLRAATALAILAESSAVTLAALPIDPAEQAAGRPIRSITITLSDPAALARVISTLGDAYRPRTVQAGSDGSSTLTWAAAVAPTPPAT
jgi:hypothetical protein